MFRLALCFLLMALIAAPFAFAEWEGFSGPAKLCFQAGLVLFAVTAAGSALQERPPQ